jgi:type III pantothenate kinase
LRLVSKQETPFYEIFASIIMNLCIDIGNTRTKLAVFDSEGSLVKFIIREQFTSGKLDKVLKKYEIQYAIVSSVKRKQGKYKRILGNKLKTFIELSAETPIPITNHYQTPQTLGKDRLAGVVGAASIFPGNDILVVDAGTCITYDIIDAEGNYYGGSIVPGITMRFKALNTFTGRLPLVQRDLLESHIGDTTLTSVQTGVQLGVVYELKGFIAKYRESYPDLRVLVTGGDASFFESQMENQIFAVPDLVLMGLNQILNYNVQQTEKA